VGFENKGIIREKFVFPYGQEDILQKEKEQTC